MTWQMTRADLDRIENSLALVLRRLDQLEAPPQREPERWLSIAETAKRVGISRATFDRLRARGAAPPCALIGSIVRYRASDVDSWAAKRVVGPAIARPQPRKDRSGGRPRNHKGRQGPAEGGAP